MRFIDEEYDGLIINLPNWFIELNGLGDIIDKFKQKVEDKVTMSTGFLDYTHSLHELENYKTKKKYSEEKKRLEKKREDELNIFYSKRVNKEVIDWNWCEYTFNTYFNVVKFENEEFDGDDFWTGTIRPPVKKIAEINEKINKLTDEEFVNFLIKLNGCYLFKDFEYGKHYRRVENTFYIDRQGFVKFRVERMSIKYYTDKNTYYPNILLNYWGEKKYNFNAPGLKNKMIYLDDYIINDNFTLTKK